MQIYLLHDSIVNPLLSTTPLPIENESSRLSADLTLETRLAATDRHGQIVTFWLMLLKTGKVSQFGLACSRCSCACGSSSAARAARGLGGKNGILELARQCAELQRCARGIEGVDLGCLVRSRAFVGFLSSPSLSQPLPLYFAAISQCCHSTNSRAKTTRIARRTPP